MVVNVKSLIIRAGGMCSTCVLVALFVAGCATNKIDWTARAGNYTYDSAVTEFGPPDKSARLQDGTFIADWITRRGYQQSMVNWSYAYPYRYHGPVLYPVYTESWAPDYFLRLTFGPDSKLQTWKKFAR